MCRSDPVVKLLCVFAPLREFCFLLRIAFTTQRHDRFMPETRTIRRVLSPANGPFRLAPGHKAADD
jgi:hypothetical protein